MKFPIHIQCMFVWPILINSIVYLCGGGGEKRILYVKWIYTSINVGETELHLFRIHHDCELFSAHKYNI